MAERVSEFTFFPSDDLTRASEVITVERRYWQGGGGPFPHPSGEWSIMQRGWCLNRDGEWEYEPLPSSRDNDFFARCRFPLDEALERAAALAADD